MPRASSSSATPVRPRGLLGNPIAQAADMLLAGGLFGALQSRDVRADMATHQRDLMGSMPTPDSYAPPQYAPPADVNGKALEDPLSSVPYATRFATWAKDYAHAGGDISDATGLYSAIKPNVSVDAESGMQTDSDGRVVGQLPRTEYINNFKVSPYAKNAPDFIPELPKGMMPDGQGGVMNLPQLPQAMGEQAGAVKGAEARATSPYEFVNVPDPQGRPRVAAKSAIAGGDFRGATPDEQAFATSRGGQQATTVTDLETQLRASDTQTKALTMAQSMLASGNVITGFGAGARLQAERAMALTGDPKAKARVAATETFQASMAPQVLALAKQLGSGTGITNADREFAEKAAGGKIELNEETVKRLLSIQQQQVATKRHQYETARGSAPNGATATGRPTSPNARPPAAPPAGTVQGGYRFNGGDPASPNSWSKL